MITLLGGIFEDSLSMGFLSNWFVAYEIISGCTCRLVCMALENIF